MKYTALGLVAIVGVSAQATNNTVASSSAAPPVIVAASTVTSNVATPTAISACAVQST